jgi:hypothetical protein
VLKVFVIKQQEHTYSFLLYLYLSLAYSPCFLNNNRKAKGLIDASAKALLKGDKK